MSFISFFVEVENKAQKAQEQTWGWVGTQADAVGASCEVGGIGWFMVLSGGFLGMGLFVPCKRNLCFRARSKAVRGPSGMIQARRQRGLSRPFGKPPPWGPYVRNQCVYGQHWGRGLSWPVAKPDVCCVTIHSMERSQALAELGICMP